MIVEGERAHLLAGGVVLLVALQDLLVALPDSRADEGGLGRVFVGLHEAGDVGAVPGIHLCSGWQRESQPRRCGLRGCASVQRDTSEARCHERAVSFRASGSLNYAISLQ